MRHHSRRTSVLALGLGLGLIIAVSAAPAPAYAQASLVSVAADGTTLGNGDNNPPSAFSADARFVAFTSYSTNLVPGDTNEGYDVFVKDRQTNAIMRVSVMTGGAERPGWSGTMGVDISDDGNFVVFASKAALVADDTNECYAGPGMENCSDVYLHDRSTGTTTRVSSNGSIQGDSHSYGPRISGDGRWIVFISSASNLVPGDDNTNGDIFLLDRVSGTLTLVSRSTGGVPSNGGSFAPAISDDGSTIAFISAANTLADEPDPLGCTGLCSRAYVHERATGKTVRLPLPLPVMSDGIIGGNVAELDIDSNGRHVVYSFVRQMLFVRSTTTVLLHDRTTQRTFTPISPESPGSVTISGNGRYIIIGSGYQDSGFVPTWKIYDRLTNHTETWVIGVNGDAPRPKLSGDGRAFLFATFQPLLLADTNSHADLYVWDRDVDHDLMTDTWEDMFGLNRLDASDAALDPDNDGLTNLQEYQAGGHPTATFRRYFAEGAHNEFFRTQFSLLNPGTSTAHTLLRFLGAGGETANTALTIDASKYDLPNLATSEIPSTFSTVVESDQPIVADRMMTWGTGLAAGSHLETAITAPGLEWYLAEGATHGSFDLFYLLQNASDTEATVTVEYLRSAGAPITKVYNVAPRSRRTIWVDDEGPDLAEVETSAHITSTQPIIVERAMYASRPDLPFLAGHEGAGATAPALRWFFAEGATGSFFDHYLLLANPGAQAAAVTLTYLLPDGPSFSKPYVVNPRSRLTISVDGEDPRLLDTPVSIIVESTNLQPVIAERAMWWPSPNWHEAHLSAGATTTGTKWGMAAGEVGTGTETYVLIANTSAQAGSATVRLHGRANFSEETLTRVVPLPANSRVNVPISVMFPAAAARGTFAVTVESDGVEIVVERAQYSTIDDVTWSQGAAALAAKLP